MVKLTYPQYTAQPGSVTPCKSFNLNGFVKVLLNFNFD